MLYIRLSDLRKTKIKDGALEKNVDYQFEFPRQCIVQKNALSLTQAPMDFALISGYLPSESYIDLGNLCYHAMISSKKKMHGPSNE